MSHMNDPNGMNPVPGPAGDPPPGGMPPGGMPPPGMMGPPPKADPIILFPMLISAIFNCLSAVYLLFSGLLSLAALFGICFLAFVPPVIILAVFEFKTFAELNRPGPHAHLAKRVQTLAWCQIATILVCNVPSMICGILQLVSKDKLTNPYA